MSGWPNGMQVFEVPTFSLSQMAHDVDDLPGWAQILASERPALLEEAFAGLLESLDTAKLQSLAENLGHVTAWVTPRMFPAKEAPWSANIVIGFEGEAPSLSRTKQTFRSVGERIRSLLDSVVADYTPKSMIAELVGARIASSTESDIRSRLRAHEALLMYFGAPSAASMAKRRLGLGA